VTCFDGASDDTYAELIVSGQSMSQLTPEEHPVMSQTKDCEGCSDIVSCINDMK
jgi:hypothetical protein